MIYNLDYVPNHGLYKLHTDVLHFFAQARGITKYNDTLYTGTLLKLVNDSPALKTRFYRIFKLLNEPGINKSRVYNFLLTNNNVEKILKNKRYSILSLPNSYKDLKDEIFSLYEFLWSNTITTLTCANNYGSIDDHYEKFYVLNKEKKICAFCGLEKIKRLVEQRNEYDHYLYKDNYPWLSINFFNLVPMCDTCNKRPNKGTKNIILNEVGKKRRLAYYPYAKVKNLVIETQCTDLLGSTEEFKIRTAAETSCQEVVTWKSVFRIDIRYSDYTKDQYRDWLKNLFNHNKIAIPANVPDLRRAIAKFINYRKGMARLPGDHLEFSFWEYLAGTSATDLRLILDYFKALSALLAA